MIINLKKRLSSLVERFLKPLFTLSWCKIAENDGFGNLLARSKVHVRSGDLLSWSKVHTDNRDEVVLVAQQ
jgi:hypothetical protein